ncbi:MAG: peptidase, partial [Actinomycetes bacterium]
MARARSRRTTGRTTGTAPLLIALACAVAALSGCSALRAASAAPGARPGVDVPRERATVSATRLGTPALAPAGHGGFTFLATRPDGSAVTFDPCRPVHFVVRPDHEPAGGRDLLLGALADVSAATGLQFVDDGATDEAPSEDRALYQPDRYGDRWAPVLVA